MLRKTLPLSSEIEISKSSRRQPCCCAIDTVICFYTVACCLEHTLRVIWIGRHGCFFEQPACRIFSNIADYQQFTRIYESQVTHFFMQPVFGISCQHAMYQRLRQYTWSQVVQLFLCQPYLTILEIICTIAILWRKCKTL